jgi:hypothetical protein
VTGGLREAEGRHLGFFAEYSTEVNQQILLKVCDVLFFFYYNFVWIGGYFVCKY